MKKLKILTVAGARPNFMKIAPLVRAFAGYEQIEQKIVHTGQHYDDNLSLVFFQELGIPLPDINLGVGSGSREEQIARVMEKFAPVVEKEKPDLVIVVGDVNSTIACARITKEKGAKAAHVEAGLRSFDEGMPEEHNRRETDQISDYLFVTEDSGLKNLIHESIKGKAFLVGNVMIDTLVYSLDRIKSVHSVEQLGLKPGHYVASTFHRPSNVDSYEDLSALVDTIAGITGRITQVLPLHPRTKHSLEHHGLMEKVRRMPNLVLTEPLGYMEFLKLVLESKAVITDSGGIQEETTYLGIPCITMRENTERPVTVSLGTNVVVGQVGKRALEELDRILAGTFKRGSSVPYWDGKAAERIAEIIIRELV
jgi:UDP-N-acetylglucosamine 2-epimerase (non-hydrolysing)